MHYKQSNDIGSLFLCFFFRQSKMAFLHQWYVIILCLLNPLIPFKNLSPNYSNAFLLPQEVSGANSKSPKAVTSDGDADTGSVILDISEGLVSSLVEPSQNGTNKTLQTAVVGRKRATKALELVPRLLEPGTRNYGKIC